MPVRRQATLDAIAARPGLVAKPKSRAGLAELAHQTIQRRYRVCGPTAFFNLAAQAVLGHRDNIAFLGNVKPDIHVIRSATGQSGATTLPAAVRRVAPFSGGHVV